MTRLESIMVKMGFDISESSKVNEAMAKVKEASGKAGEGVAGFNTKGREMHELINKLGASSPLLGSALKAAFNPEALGIVAVIALLEWVKGQFDKVKEKLKELSHEETEMWVGQQEHAIEAGKAVDDFHRKMSEATEAAMKQNDAYKQQLDALENIYGSHKKVMGAIEETLDLDKKRARQKEDEARKEKQEQQLEAVAGNSVREAALKKQFEMEEKKINATRDYQDEADKQAKEKRDRAAEEAINKAQLDVLENKQSKQVAEQQRLQSLVPGADKALVNEANRKTDLDVANRRKSVLETEMADLQDKANGGNEKAWHDLTAKQAEYKTLLTSINELGKKDDEAVRNAEKISAAWNKNQGDMEVTYHEALKLDAQIRANQKAGRAVDAEDAKRLARLKSDIAGSYGPNDSKAAALANTIANDTTLQQANQGVANARTAAEKKYWQEIADNRMRIDRARFPGVPTPDELNAVKTDKSDEDKQQTNLLTDIRDLLAGDK
jgi:hypothetical protein